MSGGLHSLATIIKRLEAATSRIEDIANFQATEARKEVTTGSPGSEPHVLASTSIPAPPPPPPPPPVPAAAVEIEDTKAAIAFDEAVVNGKLKPFVELTKSFTGASVIEIVALVEKQFQNLREFIQLSSSCQKPNAKTNEALLSPLLADIEGISRAKEAGRKDRDWFTHLSFIGESGPAVGWVVQPKPGPHIAEIKESALYYGNKVMQEFKSKDPKHVEWVKSFIAVLEEMRKYVMEYHTTGLSWNPKGITIEAYRAATSAVPPPPPPPPPSSGTGDAAAVFAELNRGEDVTKGLRKVDKSEMTHKNPALRTTDPVSSSPGSPTLGKKPVKPSKPHALAGKKPPKFALEGTRWAIEYQENERSLIVENVEMNQSVNIYSCKNCTIVIKGKVNAVTIANSQSTSVLVESVIASISVTRAPSFVLQITGSAPMIQLDNTDSGQIYLSKDSLGAEITTAKCSSINVSLPVEGEEEGVFEEQAVPDMLRTVVKDGKLVTTVVEHIG
ncbi:cyclase-associated protein [Tricholoma matsutake]|nr:cyclase-associated protein [Tricholoma matsutake 945]